MLLTVLTYNLRQRFPDFFTKFGRSPLHVPLIVQTPFLNHFVQESRWGAAGHAKFFCESSDWRFPTLSLSADHFFEYDDLFVPGNEPCLVSRAFARDLKTGITTRFAPLSLAIQVLDVAYEAMIVACTKSRGNRAATASERLTYVSQMAFCAFVC